MRAREFLFEDEKSEFDSDLEDLIIAAKANGIMEIDVDDLTAQLAAMGHSVTPDSLVNSLQSHDEHEHNHIKNITLNTITLKSHTLDNDVKQEYGDREADAGRIAGRTAMKGIKAKQKNLRKAAKDL